MNSADHAPAALSQFAYDQLVRAALREDLGDAGDVTTNAIIPSNATAVANVVARAAGRVAGLEASLWAFCVLDLDTEIEYVLNDGDDCETGSVLARIEGNARALLSAERTALNLLGRLCGIATLTRAYVQAVAGTHASIVCTRKTTPGLRALEKYAVRCGGGRNHRFGLYDAVLIKDNHVAVAGGVAAALRAAKARVGHLVKIEIEVDSIEQLAEALDAGADVVLLDNMNDDQLREAVRVSAGEALLEASGTVSLDRVAQIAATGVDLISIGRLTHSAPALDVGLDFE